MAVVACSSSKVCGLVACSNTASIATYVNLSRDQMAAATLAVCRNDVCSSGRLSTVPSAPGDSLQFSLSGSLSAQGTIASPDAAKGYRVQVDVNLDGLDLANGDTYTIRVSPDGGAAISVSGSATYSESQPNGTDCPPICRTAVIDKTQ